MSNYTHTVFFLHGVGERNPKYAQPMITNIQDALQEKKDTHVDFRQIYYGDLLQNPEDLISNDWKMNNLYKNEHLPQVRSFLLAFAGDAFQLFNSSCRAWQPAINRIASNFMSNNLPLHLVFHSWGTCIGWQFLRSYSERSVTLMGSPLAPYSLTNPLRPYTGKFPITNYFQSDDIIGSPLNLVFQNILDIEVKDCGPPTEIIGGIELPLIFDAHNSYWHSKQIASDVAHKIITRTE